MDVQYPSRFENAVLAREAGGGEPARVELVVPTITSPGEPLRLHVAVVDGRGYPSMAFDGEIVVEGAAEPVAIPFEAGRPAVAVFDGVTLDADGLHRLACRLGGKVFHSNPTCCSTDEAEPVYWGDPHVHTVLSDCVVRSCRSLNFCYVAAKWLAGLDWVAPADHVSNGRCTRGKWMDQAAASDAFNEPGVLATLPAYEASLKGGRGGDHNVYMLRWPDIYVDEYDDGSARTLCEKLADALAPGGYFVVPHHTTRTGKHGEVPDAIYPGPDLMPAIEIHSRWGTGEYRGNPRPLHKVHPGPSYVVDLLDRGLMLGFVGGTDTHTTFPAWDDRPTPDHLDRLPGLTAVRAPRLTREDVFAAIAGRNCYAASGERIYLDADVAGAAPGTRLDWRDAARPRPIGVSAAARGDIDAIEIARNGRTVARHEPGRWHGRMDFTDDEPLAGLWLDSPHLGRFVYYHVRVTCASGAQAWSSPVWLIG